MNDDKALTKLELEVTQRIQMHFPRGLHGDVLQAISGCKKDVLQEWLEEAFGNLQPFLNCLNEKPIMIGRTTGFKNIAKSEDVLTGGIENSFKSRSYNRLEVEKNATPVDIYEIKAIHDAKFAQIFGVLFGATPNKGIGKFIEKHYMNLYRRCLTQNQIREFAVEHQNMLLRGESCATLFLFIERNGFRVAEVSVASGGYLKIKEHALGQSLFWKPRSYQLVVPQLA